MKKAKHGGQRIPGPGKTLGRNPKPPGEKYIAINLKLPPRQLGWMRENVNNRNGFIVDAIDEAIKILKERSMTFSDYQEAKDHADKTGLPLWDTGALPDRYYVGNLTAEIEEDPDNQEWEQIQ
jgi:hypothetical protein